MAWDMLFGTPVGLMSLATIVMVIAIGVFMYRFIKRKMDEEPGDGTR